MSSVYMPLRPPMMLAATMLSEIARAGAPAQHEDVGNYLSDAVEAYLAQQFEQVFGVTLGEYYATIEAMKRRGAKVAPLVAETIADVAQLNERRKVV
jgi:hypothetical protein